MKEVKIMVLVSGERIIGNMEYIQPKDNEVWMGHYEIEDPKIIIPQKVEGKFAVSLDPWLVFAKQDKVDIGENLVITVVDPIESIRKAYLQCTSKIAIPPAGMKVMS